MMCDDIVRGVGANSATGLRGSNAQKRANANLVKPFCLCRSGQAELRRELWWQLRRGLWRQLRRELRRELWRQLRRELRRELWRQLWRSPLKKRYPYPLRSPKLSV